MLFHLKAEEQEMSISFSPLELEWHLCLIHVPWLFPWCWEEEDFVLPSLIVWQRLCLAFFTWLNTWTCPFSLSSRNKHVCQHFYRMQNCNLTFFCLFSFALYSLQKWWQWFLFVTFGQYSNVYIFCDSVNWLTSGCGQVKQVLGDNSWVGAHRHLFLIL